MSSNPTSSHKRSDSESTPAPELTLEQLKVLIAKRAKEIYTARIHSNTSGDDLGDWLEAEKKVKAKLGIKG